MSTILIEPHTALSIIRHGSAALACPKCGNAGMIRLIVQDVQPLPKQRPRVVKGRAYTPGKTRDYEALVRWRALEALAGRPTLTGDLRVAVEFRRKGNRRADLDNLLKAVLDGVQGVLFVDDQQIVNIVTRVEYGATVPGFTLTVQEAS